MKKMNLKTLVVNSFVTDLKDKDDQLVKINGGARSCNGSCPRTYCR